MDTSQTTNKDILINHISHGLILCGIEFKAPITKRLSVKSLQARLTWLRKYYVARCQGKPMVHLECQHCGQVIGDKS